MSTPQQSPIGGFRDPLGTSPTPGAPPSTGGAAGPAAAPPTAPAPARRGGTGRAIGRTLALALLVFVTVVLVLFVLFNTQTVLVSLVFGNVQAPLVVALVLAAVLGGLVVWLASRVMRVRKRNR